MALGGHAAVIVREMGPRGVISSYTISRNSRVGSRALGRTLNTPLIYAQLVVNWLGTLLDPASAQEGTSMTFDAFKNGALMSVYESTFEQNELAWDIFEGATHAGVLTHLNEPIKELGGAIRGAQLTFATTIADVVSYCIRVVGGAIITSVQAMTLTISFVIHVGMGIGSLRRSKRITGMDHRAPRAGTVDSLGGTLIHSSLGWNTRLIAFQ